MGNIEIANSFKIRSSATIEIMGTIGLTEIQLTEMKDLAQRKADGIKPLTAKMQDKLTALQTKHFFPELPEGAKTYCKKWLKEFHYGRRKDLKTKQVKKGNLTEEDGFTLMATELNLGMVYKNKDLKENSYSKGTCDLNHKKTVYDNKSSYDLDTFPMYENEITDKRYWWQLQSYGILEEAEGLVLCYTLNNATVDMVLDAIRWTDNHDEKYKIVEQMIFTKEVFELYRLSHFPDSVLNTFVEIPDEKRIKSFEFLPVPELDKQIEARVKMCREYILTLLN